MRLLRRLTSINDEKTDDAINHSYKHNVTYLSRIHQRKEARGRIMRQFDERIELKHKEIPLEYSNMTE
ncbi:MAG: hypothetical protein LRY71_17355 [Bacillaceae bacterium]|nr:hypothetical protein [Bacillaceae bacterium]